MAGAVGNDRLDTFEALRRGVALVLEERRGAVQVSWLYGGLLVLVNLMWVFLVPDIAPPEGAGELDAQGLTDQDIQAFVDQLLAAAPVIFLCGLVSIVLSSAISVSWMRRVRLDEPLPRLAPPIDSRVLKTVLGYVVLAIASFAVSLPFSGLTMLAGGGEGPLPMLLAVVWFVASFFVFARLSMIFVHAALENRLGILDSWRLTAGNAWRIVSGTLVLVFGFLLIALIVRIVLASLGAGIGLVATDTVLNVVASLIFAGYLAEAHRQLVEIGRRRT